MKLVVGEKEIEVKPLSYKRSKRFQTRLEELDKSRSKIKTEDGSGWTNYYGVAELVTDMLVDATGLDKEEVEDALPMADVGDWLLYLQHGPSAIEKKKQAAATTPTS
jgi:hypothetical protein